MEPAIFVVATLAGAVLKRVADDAYNGVKAKLASTFGLSAELELLEKKPADENVRRLLSSQLVSTGAIDDADVIGGADSIATQLEKLPDDTSLGANLTVRDLKAEAATFRNVSVRSGGRIEIEKVNLEGHLTIEDVVVGDGRKS